MTEPKNAFMKKIFQKKRQIVPIQQLVRPLAEETHAIIPQLISRKPKRIKVKASIQFVQPISVDALKNKLQPDRSTKDETELSLKKSSIKHRTGLSEASRSLSQSKRIKYSIIHNDAHC